MAIDVKSEYFGGGEVPAGATLQERYQATKDPNEGGEDPARKSRLNFNQIKEWNQFIDSTPNKNADLNTLYLEYKKKNPSGAVPIDALRNELDLLSRKMTNDSARRNELGSEYSHTGNRFIHAIVDGKDYGAMNGEGTTEQQPKITEMPASMIKQVVPDWVETLEWNQERQQPYYKDGNDIVYVDRKFYNSPRFLKPQDTRIANK